MWQGGFKTCFIFISICDLNNQFFLCFFAQNMTQFTARQTNMSPENQWLEDVFPIDLGDTWRIIPVGKWLIAMVMQWLVSPLIRVVGPLPNGLV